MKFLVIDDYPYDRELLIRYLRSEFADVEFVEVRQRSEFDEALVQANYDVVLTDYRLGWSDGLSILKTIKERLPEVPVMMVTDTGNEEIAAEGMKAGLSDYVLKRHPHRFALAVKESLEKVRLQRQYNEIHQQLQQSEERHRIISELVSDYAYVMRIEADGRPVYEWVNDTFTRLTGYGLTELNAYPEQSVLSHPDDLPAVLRRLDRLVSRDVREVVEFRIQTKSGETRWIRDFGCSIWDEAQGRVSHIYGAAQDITERKALEERLAHQAFHDLLTGLPNRTLFLDRLEHALVHANQYQTTIAVIFIDLDNFKVINDSLGHALGDQLLLAVAEQLQSCLGTGDTIARFGGDEFILLLENLAGVSDAKHVAERITESLRSPFTIAGHELFVTTSIGIAHNTSGGNVPQDLLRHADVALYHAKREGRARYVVFVPRMNDQAHHRLRLERELRRAIDHGELRVHYQPIVDLEHGTIQEVEALVRWEHPELGLVPPADFIPLAEETGLILPIGDWVLEQVCRQGRAWQKQYPHDPPLTLSVNLSPRQFRHRTLVADIERVLSESGLAPGSLNLEITESLMMERSDTIIAMLSALKDRGIRITIDDFGTGYSSLAYLRRFPVDSLKIDRSFINGVEHNHEDQALVSAMIAVGKALHLAVIAEGVETVAQATLLYQLGCRRGQGYLFARPAPGEVIGVLLQQGRVSREWDTATASAL